MVGQERELERVQKVEGGLDRYLGGGTGEGRF